MSELDTVFGIHAVESLLTKDPEQIVAVKVMKGRDDKRLQRLLGAVRDAGIITEVVPRKILDDLVRGRHQGVVALVKLTPEKNENDLDSRGVVTSIRPLKVMLLHEVSKDFLMLLSKLLHIKQTKMVSLLLNISHRQQHS